ncbi:MAG: 3-methyl-2-oxobutanoate hydroxymethyltransferase [Elusimicrobiales bacterium]
MQITDFYEYDRKAGRKISMITAYDYITGQLAQRAPVDCVLVGDSLSMTVYGHDSTIHADMGMMERHTAMVARAVRGKLLVGDMPFLSYHKEPAEAVENAGRLARAGAQAVKLEGAAHEEAVRRIIASGVPVMGHLGLTPQSVNLLGGFRVQGRRARAAAAILACARKLERLGCFALVLECVPRALGKAVTAALKIPVIGIGAGPDTDGQVLVIADMLGFCENAPRFLKRYMDGAGEADKALRRFDREVKSGAFPAEEHCYK